VAVFDQADHEQDLAYQLMLNSVVHLFWRPALFDEAGAWLTEHGYRLVRLDASGWDSAEAMHEAMAAALDFPDHYGRNLDALHDCLTDVLQYDDWTPPDATGFVFAFTGYETFAQACPEVAHAVLDIIAGHSREAMLTGRRVFALVQTADPDFRMGPVGAMPVLWNHIEWLDANRHPAPEA
jgi:Barstar (barnase inhibitor)